MKTHPLNVTYLVIGLVFLAIAGSWALRETGVIDTDDVTWLGPVALIVAGGVGVVAAVAKSLRRGRASAGSENGYQPHYDPPLPQDYTSDLDRKLDEAERTSVLSADRPADQPANRPADDTTVINQQGEDR
jgi:hypothetical protein